MSSSLKTVTLALCMIVKDEEQRLERVLQSSHKIFDEIIIVDTGSSDKTKEIAGKFTEQIFDYKWNDNFAKARNFSISKCKSEYWMWLDADDYIEEADVEKLKQLKSYLKNEYSEPDFFILPYHYCKGKDSTTKSLVLRERIFKVASKAKFIYPIHEIVQTSGLKGVTIKDINIYHQDITLESRKDKTKRNIKLINKALRSINYKNDLHLQNHLGLAYLSLGDYKKAIKVYSKCFNECVQREVGEIEQAKYLTKIAFCNEKLENYAKTIELCLQATAFDPFIREPFVLLAQSFYKLNSLQKALFWYQVADSIPLNVQRSSLDASYYNHHVKDAIASIYYLLGDHRQAYEYANKALSLAPNSDRLKSNVTKLKRILKIA
ncbi:MAG: glycosyltransferase [Candidatus Caenarcaniphilales bacterium]|nr:glycosyltransferase [Candidatus Caenarcaniphilales bacterium]